MSARPDDDALGAVASSFYAAAMGNDGWDTPLAALADVTGSRSGALLGLGEAGTVLTGHFTDLPPEQIQHFMALNGTDPRVNCGVATALKTRELEVIAECDYATPEQLKVDPFYADYMARWDVPFTCQTPLIVEPGYALGVGVLRTERQGHVEAPERAMFAALAPRIQGAMRMHQALETQGAQLLVGAMDALSVPVFVFGAGGQLMAQSPAATALLSDATFLSGRAGRLRAVLDADTRRLDEAIAAASTGSLLARRATTIAVRNHDGSDALVIDVAPYPDAPTNLGFAPRCVATIRQSRGPDTTGAGAALVRDFYGLTLAEAQVALLVVEGLSLDEIAQQRAVALGTTRTQLKALFAKVGVNRQLDLVKRLERFLG